MAARGEHVGDSSGARTARWAVAAAAVTLALVAAACGDDDDDDATGGSTVAPVPHALDGSTWVLGSAVIDDEVVASAAVAALDFGADGTTLNGSTGCNQFGGTFQQNGDELTIELGPMTEMACTDPAITAQETAITTNLPKVATFSADGQLTLFDESGATLFIYDPGIAGLEGTAWSVTGVNSGNGGVESTVLTEALTADFAAGGQMSGFAGCNQYNGTYATSGTDGLTITNVATTRKACEDDVMSLESQFVTALGNVATYQLSGDQLTLRDADGATQVSLRAAG